MSFFRGLVVTLGILVLSACHKSGHTPPQYIKSQHKSRLNAPFSDATEHNGLLYLTGQIGKDHATGNLVKGGIKAETAQVLNNIKDVLEANGSDMNHVLKCTVILSDINDFSIMNDVYRTYFPNNKPARTTFGANLVGNASIEIDVIAVKK